MRDRYAIAYLFSLRIHDKVSKIAQLWGARKIVGVDIDETLIRAAWKRRRTVWSSSVPRTLPAPNASDCEDSDEPDYFPAAFEHMFGPLPIPSHTEHCPSDKFPHNITFQTADWVQQRIHEDTEGYDVVLAYDIHLFDVSLKLGIDLQPFRAPPAFQFPSGFI